MSAAKQNRPAAATSRWSLLWSGLTLGVALLLAIGWLTGLSRAQVRWHMIDQAAELLGPVLHGSTPYRWALDSQTDVVTGKAFGATQTVFSPHGVELQAGNEVMELGVVIPRALDLRRFRDLRVNLTTATPVQLSVVVGADLRQPACISSVTHVPAGTTHAAIELSQLDWQCDGVPSTLPTRAAMLRLRLDVESGRRLQVSDLQLLPSIVLTASTLKRMQPFVEMPAEATTHGGSDHAHEPPAGQSWLMLTTDTNARAEEVLARIDGLNRRDPGIVVVHVDDWRTAKKRISDWRAPSDASGHPVARWLAWVGYALLLLALRLKPPSMPRLRALLELIGVLAGPLWLVVGGHYRDGSDPHTLLIAGVSLGFAASLLIGAAPLQPTATALRRGWAVAAISVVVALVFVLMVRDPARSNITLSVATALRYLLWAAIQQFLICVIVAERLQQLLRSARWAVLLAACIFALLHTPNETLMLFTLIGGLIWVWNWQRHRALLPNIVAHTICGLLLSSQLPPLWLRSAEVSARYFF